MVLARSKNLERKQGNFRRLYVAFFVSVIFEPLITAANQSG